MRRLLQALVVAMVVPFLTAAPAHAGPPRIYHTIVSDHGAASFDQTVGCVRTEVWVSSSVAMYASQPGPVNKQGLTGVLVRVSDVCAVVPGAVAPGAVVPGAVASGAGEPAAGGGGGVVLAEYDARAMVPLVVDPRLRWASVSADLPSVDDPAVVLHVDARWTATGPLEHSTTVSHVLFPGVGVVSATANELTQPAEAVVSVQVADVDVRDAVDPQAQLSETRSRCVENPRPGVDEFYPCFGFPG